VIITTKIIIIEHWAGLAERLQTDRSVSNNF